MMSTPAQDSAPRRKRADAVRNTESVLEAAKAAFAESGVDAPMRDIAARAGVGVGTIYRNYPLRSDLIIAVFRREVDATAAEAGRLAGEYPPPEALRRWTARFAGFVATKRGFASALHSGDPAYQSLPKYFVGTLAPKVQSILDAGARDSSIRDDVRAEELIHALSRLAQDRSVDTGEQTTRMTDVLLDGLFLCAPGESRN
ncbi:TetR/AcrR family transcriptional regulator [Microbacterium murale]|uniref:AcrR family transcriptional regulator n=1 Tax=Microbacterium murale TaxID=1081040 RepID=A0ABU0PDA7_9MICO|nr:TetR/AcrR family transcriptional regulator [Microbacterium murale]MDQ0645321.1 AcrR family transcriptional regulator [Microbacterium murale]